MRPSTNIEREVKLDVGLRFELPELNGIIPGLVATRLPDAKLQAIYVDTADLRLMRWGVTLRHRRDAFGGAGAESGWTVKLPMVADGVAVVRNELSWPGAFGPVPAEVASLVRAQARTARLVPVAKLLTERHRVELRDRAGRKLAEVDDDVVSVMDGRRLAARFRQVELEVTDAAPAELLVEVLRALTLVGAVAGDDRPKVVRAIGPRASLGPDIVIPALDNHSTVATVVGAAIAAGVTRMIRHDPGVRLGDDPEHVHQARVGTRRLRSDLRTFWRLLDPDWARPLRDELGWLGAAYGEVRDTDVLLGRFRGPNRNLSTVDSKAAAALLRRLAAQREEARVHLLAALNSDRYLMLLENLAQAAADPPLARTEGDQERSPIPEAAVAEGGPDASVEARVRVAPAGTNGLGRLRQRCRRGVDGRLVPAGLVAASGGHGGHGEAVRARPRARPGGLRRHPRPTRATAAGAARPRGHVGDGRERRASEVLPRPGPPSLEAPPAGGRAAGRRPAPTRRCTRSASGPSDCATPPRRWPASSASRLASWRRPRPGCRGSWATCRTPWWPRRGCAARPAPARPARRWWRASWSPCSASSRRRAGRNGCDRGRWRPRNRCGGG